jgi:hypothetical protein
MSLLFLRIKIAHTSLVTNSAESLIAHELVVHRGNIGLVFTCTLEGGSLDSWVSCEVSKNNKLQT